MQFHNILTIRIAEFYCIFFNAVSKVHIIILNIRIRVPKYNSTGSILFNSAVLFICIQTCQLYDLSIVYKHFFFIPYSLVCPGYCF